MKYLATLGAVCAIGLGAMAGQAQADIYHFTQTGTIHSGSDTQGLFGNAGADLAGQAYSVTFTFDPGLLEFNSVDDAAFQVRGYMGDTGIAKVTIGGASYSYTVDGPYGFTFGNFKGNPAITGGWEYAVSTALYGSHSNLALGIVSATDFRGAIDLSTLYDYALTDADRTFNGPESSYWEGSDFKFAFRPDAISLTSEPGTLAPPAPVPEPASWALMIAGFGLAGGVMRTRRRLVGEPA
jgi:hypothetical protein